MTRRYWTAEEDDYVRANAGKRTYTQIARALGRTESAVRSRYMRIETFPARANEGMTALTVAKEYGCPVKRVWTLIANGLLRARKCGRGYWVIRPEEAEKVRHLLTAPKRTWKADPPATGVRRPWEVAG